MSGKAASYGGSGAGAGLLRGELDSSLEGLHDITNGGGAGDDGMLGLELERYDLGASAELYTPTVVAPPPALLSLSGDGKGQGAILHAGTPQLVSAGKPAVAGETLEIYCAGLADGGVIPRKWRSADSRPKFCTSAGRRDTPR